MSDEMSETLVAEVGRLRAENAQLKAALELVTASRDTVLERMDWQGKWGRWCAKLQDENNTLKAELAQTKQREARRDKWLKKSCWAEVRNILELGAAIYQDYQGGKYSGYEEYSAHVDDVARKRSEKIEHALGEAGS